jgi:hypothetical protein
MPFCKTCPGFHKMSCCAGGESYTRRAKPLKIRAFDRTRLMPFFLCPAADQDVLARLRTAGIPSGDRIGFLYGLGPYLSHADGRGGARGCRED